MRNPVLRNLCREIADNLIGLSPTIRVENEFYFERGSETIVVSGKKLDDEFEVEFREITKATVINKNIVKELWPSLVFDKEKK